MNKTDTERLVRKAAVLDNRVVNDAVIDAWHEIVGDLSYRVAERSLLKARQDPSVTYLEPKHILAKVRDVIAEFNAEERDLARQAELEGRADPEPLCSAHGTRITTCQPCYTRLYEWTAGLNPTQAHAWAVEHLYEVSHV
jgi:hypothetical protein